MVSGDAYFRFILADGCLGASNTSSRPLLIIFFLINKYWWGGGAGSITSVIAVIWGSFVHMV